MATYNGTVFDLPMTASGDLDTAQYHFVMPATTAKRVLLASGGSGPAPMGVLQNDPRSLEAATVRVMGTTQLYMSTACGAIGYGDWITSGSDGQGVLAAGAGGSNIHGMALAALASGSGVVLEAYIFPNPLSGCDMVTDNTP